MVFCKNFLHNPHLTILAKYLQIHYYPISGKCSQILYFSEYDECSNSAEHGCEHECLNTLGGYSCQCRIGYELHSDEKRCESKDDPHFLSFQFYPQVLS